MKSFLVISAAGLLFFAPLLLHPDQVLYADASDFLLYHVPVKTFLVRSWQQTGEVPLWCPFSFGGAPFIHDIQVGAFYPLHLPLYLLPSEKVGAGLSWLVVVHVVVAGWCMDRYARYHGLRGSAALVAALSYMFAGKWMLHIFGGHYVTVGLAWLPLVLLLFEKAIQRHSFLAATWAGAVFALIILSTQPQWTLYAAMFVVLWTFGPLTMSRDMRAMWFKRWLIYGVWMALVAVGLTAVQWLPTWEAAPYTSRVAADKAPHDLEQEVRQAAVSAAQRIPLLVGASLVSPVHEDRGNLGFVFLVAVVFASVLCGGRERYQSGVCLLLLLLAVTGLLELSPGFNLFRKSMRLLVTLALPMAFLAGVATQALFAKPGPPSAALRRCRFIMLALLVAAIALLAILAQALHRQNVPMRLEAYWFTLVFTVPAVLWILRQQGKDSDTVRRGVAVHRWRFVLREAAWVVILVVDLAFLTRPLVAVKPQSAVFPESDCIQYLARSASRHGRVLDHLDAEGRSPLGRGAPMALLAGIEPLTGYNPTDVLRYKEYLQFIMDKNERLRLFESGLTFPIIGDVEVRNKSLLDLLGTRYLLQPQSAEQSANSEENKTHGAGRTPRAALIPSGWHKVAEDKTPRAYNFHAGGVQQLGPYAVYENKDVFPRAFIVSHASPLPPHPEALAKLKATDFHREVLLEKDSPFTTTASNALRFRPAEIDAYQPNRISITLDAGPPGFLVLTDTWFPGWTCTVDGHETPVYRANFLFRAVELPADARKVEFVFRPRLYRWGRILTLAALVGVMLLTIIGLAKTEFRALCGASR